MRIITGRFGGRTIESPKGHRTHPMSDKIRGALFNALGDLTGLTVLDAFAGSGAVSIEAISRGARSSVAIDIDKSANTTLVNNITTLGLTDQIQIVRANARSWSVKNRQRQYDLVLLDPPYNDVQIELVERLARHCTVGGLVVMSLPPNTRIILPPENYERISEKSYGDATLTFFRRIS